MGAVCDSGDHAPSLSRSLFVIVACVRTDFATCGLVCSVLFRLLFCSAFWTRRLYQVSFLSCAALFYLQFLAHLVLTGLVLLVFSFMHSFIASRNHIGRSMVMHAIFILWIVFSSRTGTAVSLLPHACTSTYLPHSGNCRQHSHFHIIPVIIAATGIWSTEP